MQAFDHPTILAIRAHGRRPSSHSKRRILHFMSHPQPHPTIPCPFLRFSLHSASILHPLNPPLITLHPPTRSSLPHLPTRSSLPHLPTHPFITPSPTHPPVHHSLTYPPTRSSLPHLPTHPLITLHPFNTSAIATIDS